MTVRWINQENTIREEQPIEIKKHYCPGCNKIRNIRMYLNYYWCKTCDFRERI